MMIKRIARVLLLTSLSMLLAALSFQISAAQGTTPPSGEIAFSSNRSGTDQIYVMNADGSSVRQLTHETISATFPIWSPDGQRLLYVRGVDSEHGDLAVMNGDGSDSFTIAPLIGDPYNCCVWSPDSQWIVYPVQVGTGNNVVTRFHRTKANGTADQLLDFSPYNTSQDYIRFVRFFPDGKHLLIGDSNALYTADADGSNVQPLTSQLEHYPFAVSPDGQHIIGIHANGIAKIDSKGGNLQPLFSALTNNQHLDFQVLGVGSLNWSPNGSYIWGGVVTAPNAGTATPDSQTLPVDQVFIGTANGDDYWFRPAADKTLSWSPNSQWVTYTTQDSDGHHQVAISQPIGTDAMILTSGSDNSQPAWRPSPKTRLFN